MVETLVVIALIATVLVLFAGVIVMLRGGEWSRRYSNKLMRLRLVTQAVAVALMAVLFFMNRG